MSSLHASIPTIPRREGCYTCLLHGFGHCWAPSAPKSCVGRRDLKQQNGAQTWETAVVLAPWMRTDLTHFSNLEIRTASGSHLSLFWPCHVMHVIVHEEYVHYLRAVPSTVAFENGTSMPMLSNTAPPRKTPRLSHNVTCSNCTPGCDVPNNKTWNVKDIRNIHIRS